MPDDLYMALSSQGDLPESIRGASYQVFERIELARRELADSTVAPLLPARSDLIYRLSGNDVGNIITILGDRGVGKTTALYGVISRYEKKAAINVADDIVLPVVRPGHFAEHDSIFSWCLYFLSEFAAAGHLDREGVERAELKRKIADLQRLHALRELDHVTWATADVVPERAAARVATLSALQPEISASWQRLTVHLTQPHDGQHPLIIVPVDDLDVGGMKIRALLEELQQLTVHPAVVAVVCLHRADVEMALTRYETDRMPSHLSPSEGERQRLMAEGLASQTMAKLLPSHLRVELLPMSTAEALQFHPMHSTVSLGQLLQQVPVASLGSDHSLLDLFVISSGEHSMHTPFAKLLPRLARDLEQLYEGISILLESGETTLRSVMEFLARLALANIRSKVPLRLRDRIPAMPSTSDERWRIDLSNFRILTNIAGGAAHNLPDNGRVRFRHIVGYPIGFTGEEDGGTAVVPQQMEGLVQLLIESTNLDALSDELLPATKLGSINFPGGRNADNHIEVSINGERTDNEFLLIPEWESAFDYYIHIVGWNAMVERTVSHSKAADDNDAAADLTYLIAGNTGIIASIAATRCLPQWLIEHTIDIRELGDPDSAHTLAWFDEIGSLVCDSFARAYENSSSSQRNRDYVFWVVDHLLWAADQCFAPSHVASWLRKVWENAIEAAPDLNLEDAVESASRSLAGRIQGSLNSGWVTSPLKLLDSLDPATSERIRQTRLYDDGRLQTERQSMITQLRKTAFPEPLIQAIEISGVTDDIRNQLLMHFPAETVQQIATRFPSSVALDGMLREQPTTRNVVTE